MSRTNSKKGSIQAQQGLSWLTGAQEGGREGDIGLAERGGGGREGRGEKLLGGQQKKYEKEERAGIFRVGIQNPASLRQHQHQHRHHHMPANSAFPLLLRRVACLLSLRAIGCDALYAWSNPGEPPEYCTLFNHMVKSGGSTIKDKLDIAAKADGVDGPAMCVNGVGYEDSCLKAMHSAPVIVGYAELLRYPLEVIGRECEYFTVMRHPIDRLLSAFFYCPAYGDVQDRPPKWCGYANDPQPVTDRLVEFAKYGWKNKAFRQMTFGLYCPPNAFCEQAEPGAQQAVHEPGGWILLEQIEAILATYTAVGILEYWDLSMQLFNARVTSPVWDWEDMEHSNRGQRSGLRDEVHRWAHMSPEIHRVMATDMLLYDYSVSVFKLQTSASLGTIWE